MLGADILVLHPLRFTLGDTRHGAQPGRGVSLGAAVGLRLPAQQTATLLQHPDRLDPQPPKHARDDTVRLLDEGEQQVLRLDLRMMRPFREPLRGLHPLVRLLRIAVEIHDGASPGRYSPLVAGAVSRAASAS